MTADASSACSRASVRVRRALRSDYGRPPFCVMPLPSLRSPSTMLLFAGFFYPIESSARLSVVLW
eukprot:3980904-Pyramimonas_sp.AAC.1